MREPTILEYLQSLIRQDNKITLGDYFGSPGNREKKPSKKTQIAQEARIQWQVVAGCALAMAGQFLLEPNRRWITAAIGLYALAAVLVWVGYRESNLNAFEKKDKEKPFSSDIRLLYFAVSLIFVVAAFLFFHDNSFTLLNVTLWLLGIIFFIIAVWEKPDERAKACKAKPGFTLIFIVILGISAFYRFYRLNQIPGEMFSDHAEKLLDVMDVLNGKTSIFFTRNTGREALQFYLTAAIIKLFRTGISFLSLKLGTAITGFTALPFIYLLGKQLGNKWVGLIAMLMAGIAYWPNVISRVALRFAFYPALTAPVLYFLFRGLQERNRNYLVLSGLFLGLALQGYSPARIVPIYVLVVFGIYELHQSQIRNRLEDLWALGLLVFSSFLVFLPLFRYFLENPQMVSYRALSRLTSSEQIINGSPISIFFGNLWKASIMFFYDNGQIWVHSIPHRPALDIISAAFFFTGLIFVVKRYIKLHKWEDLALLTAIPILMLPSILSLAFPDENPSLNRTGGAIVPVFIISAIGFFQCARGIFSKKEIFLKKIVLSFILLILAIFSLIQNYDLVFSQYHEQFLANAWNTSEIGQVIAQFTSQGNSYDHAYVVPYPYWVDTRLVGINAGVPNRDYALWPEDFEQVLNYAGKKLLILYPEDTQSLQLLQHLFPEGKEEIFHSKTAGKDFIIYTIS